MSLRLYGLEIFRSDFRFHITDKDSESFFVFYNDERLTVNCSCPSGGRCSHTAYLHETMNNESDDVLLSYLKDSREGNSQDVTKATVERMRGAFAREYNLAKGIVQYPADLSPRGPRVPLGWEGSVPGFYGQMRVIELSNRENIFAVYELGSDKYSTVECISIQKCNNNECQGRETFCKHEQALRKAIDVWRENGLLPKSQISGKTADSVVMDDLTMVEKVEPVSRTGDLKGGWITIPPGFDGTWIIGEDLSVRGYKKKLLEKKEKPKPEKPAKPRTRFTDLEL